MSSYHGDVCVHASVATGSSSGVASVHTAVPETEETIRKRRAFILQAADSRQWVIDVTNNSNFNTNTTAATDKRSSISHKRSSTSQLQSTFGAGWGSCAINVNVQNNATGNKQQKAVLKVNAIQDALYAAATNTAAVVQPDGTSPYR
jgi:hypothetical protein